MGKMPVVELTTSGRKSGEKRSVMLTAPIVDGDDVVLVASKGGRDTHPLWYLNLQAQPEVEIVMDGTTRAMRARTADAEERKVLMQLLFPLKDKERFCYLYQDMTLEQYTAKVVTKARDLLDSDIFPYGSEIRLRLSDLAEIDNISAEAAELYGAWKDAEARHNAHKDEEGWF